MSSRVVEFRIGLMVLAAIATTVALTILFGPKSSMINLGGYYTIKIRFDSAPGITENSPVRKNGIKIGRVREVKFVDNDRQVEVIAEIDQGRRIYTDEVCRINRTFIGDSSLDFVKVDTETEPEVVEPGTVITGVVPPDPIQMVGSLETDIHRAINSVSDAADNMGDFIQRINSVIGTPEEIQVKQQRFDRILSQSEETMISINRVANTVNTLVGDPQMQENLMSMTQNIDKLMSHVEVLVGEMRVLVNNASSTTERVNTSLDLVDHNLENLDQFTGALGDQGPEIISALVAASEQLELLMVEIRHFGKNLNNPEGSLGQMINDPNLFKDIQNTIHNVEEITNQVQPILSDARVFTDKIARDPSVLGVRGALSKQPPLKGLPAFTSRNGPAPSSGIQLLRKPFSSIFSPLSPEPPVYYYPPETQVLPRSIPAPTTNHSQGDVPCRECRRSEAKRPIARNGKVTPKPSQGRAPETTAMRPGRPASAGSTVPNPTPSSSHRGGTTEAWEDLPKLDFTPRESLPKDHSARRSYKKTLSTSPMVRTERLRNDTAIAPASALIPKPLPTVSEEGGAKGSSEEVPSPTRLKSRALYQPWSEEASSSGWSRK